MPRPRFHRSIHNESELGDTGSPEPEPAPPIDVGTSSPRPRRGAPPDARRTGAPAPAGAPVGVGPQRGRRRAAGGPARRAARPDGDRSRCPPDLISDHRPTHGRPPPGERTLQPRGQRALRRRRTGRSGPDPRIAGPGGRASRRAGGGSSKPPAGCPTWNAQPSACATWMVDRRGNRSAHSRGKLHADRVRGDAADWHRATLRRHREDSSQPWAILRAGPSAAVSCPLRPSRGRIWTLPEALRSRGTSPGTRRSSARVRRRRPSASRWRGGRCWAGRWRRRGAVRRRVLRRSGRR